MFKRTLCLLLALLAIAGNLPVFAFAAEEEPTEILDSKFDASVSLDGDIGMVSSLASSQYYQYFYYDSAYAEGESNNSRGSANELPVSYYSHIAWKGKINSKKDPKDFYKFTITDTMYMKLLVRSAHPKKMSSFALYDSNGDKLKTISYKERVKVTSKDTDVLYYLQYALNPGTYYIRAYEPKQSGYSYVASEYNMYLHLFPRLDKPTLNAIEFNAETGKPIVTWGSVANATYYKVYRATSKSGTYSEKATVYGTTWTDTSAKAGKTYYYKVRAYTNNSYYADSNYESSQSSYKRGVCDCARPVIVDASYENGKLYLDWDKVSGATSYKIYRYNTATSESKLIKTTEKTSYTYSKALKEPYGYYVRACAKSKYSYSAWSTIVMITDQ